MKIHDLIGTIIIPGRYIIQFSPIRTGSTLIYNVIRECLPDKRIKKAHTFDKCFERLAVVSTIRHPLDCIASVLRVKSAQADDKSIDQAVADFDTSGVNDLIKITELPNTLIFKYESFTKDLNPVFDSLESKFQIEISYETRERIVRTYSVQEMAKTSRALGEFSNWDPVTKVHGNHISATLGEPGLHKEVFTQDQIEKLKGHYRGIMKRFG